MSSPTHEPCRRERCDKGTKTFEYTTHYRNKFLEYIDSTNPLATAYKV